jgi:hypothetical protein
VRNPDLFLDGKGHSRALHAITQSGVVQLNGWIELSHVKFLIGTASTDEYGLLTLVARMRNRFRGQALVIRRVKVRKVTKL